MSRARRDLFLLFGVALAARLLYLAQLAGSPLGSHLLGDGVAYDAWARRIAAGDWLGGEVFYQAPLYPYLLAVLYGLPGFAATSVRWLQALLGAVACVLLARAGERFFDRRSGLVAGASMALYPPAIFFDGEVQKAALAFFLTTVLLGLVAGFRERRGAGRAAAIGAVVGLFALLRENALILVPLLLPWMLLAPGREAGGRRRFVLALAFVAGALAPLAPVALRNTAIGGEPVLTTSQLGTNFYIGNNPGADGRYHPLRPGRGSARYEREDAVALAEAAVGRKLSSREVSRYWLGRSLDYVRAEPGRWLALLGRKWLLVWNAREIVDTTSLEAAMDVSAWLRLLGRLWHFGVLAPLAAVGLWLTRRRWRELLPLYLMLFGWAASVAAFFVFARYRFPMVPILALFAGRGALGIWDAVRERRVASVAPALALALPLAVLANWPLDPRDPRAVTYASLGRAMEDAGDLEGAERMLAHAVELSPRFAEAQRALGDVRLQRDELEAAEASYRAAVEADPEDAVAWNNLGVAAARRGRLGEAREAFRRALAADPTYRSAQENLERALDLAADAADGRPASVAPP